MATAEPTDHIGTRIKVWRRRRGGMTQAALAGRAGVSQSFISHVESGHKSIERRSTLVAFADALQVSVSDLLGQPGDPTDPRKGGAAAHVPAIEAALVEVEEGERRTPRRGNEEMAAAMAHLSELRCHVGYADLARLLPDLLLDAAAHGGVYLARVGYDAGVVLKHLGYRELERSAARVALAGAEEADDPAWIGATRFKLTTALYVVAPGVASRAAERSLNALQAKAADPNVRQTLGQLHLSASLACGLSRPPRCRSASTRWPTTPSSRW